MKPAENKGLSGAVPTPSRTGGLKSVPTHDRQTYQCQITLLCLALEQVANATHNAIWEIDKAKANPQQANLFQIREDLNTGLAWAKNYLKGTKFARNLG